MKSQQIALKIKLDFEHWMFSAGFSITGDAEKPKHCSRRQGGSSAGSGEHGWEDTKVHDDDDDLPENSKWWFQGRLCWLCQREQGCEGAAWKGRKAGYTWIQQVSSSLLFPLLLLLSLMCLEKEGYTWIQQVSWGWLAFIIIIIIGIIIIIVVVIVFIFVFIVFVIVLIIVVIIVIIIVVIIAMHCDNYCNNHDQERSEGCCCCCCWFIVVVVVALLLSL